MRTILVRAALLLVAASLSAVVAAKDIKWEASYETALAAAKKSGKLLMIDFWTDWCGWCNRLDEDTYPDAAVVAQSKRMVNVKVDGDSGPGPDLVKKYAIRGYPTILFIDGNGEVFGRIVGYEPPEPFARDIKRIIDGHADFPKLKSRLAVNEKDVEAAARLAAIYAGKGEPKEAESCLAKAEKADPNGDSALLSAAYNALGDYYQNERKYEEARANFEKGLKVSKNGTDKSYARISIAYCYLTERKLKEAKPYLEALVAQGDAPEADVTTAKQILEYIAKQEGSDGG
jgi:thioredoxin-related protein